MRVRPHKARNACLVKLHVAIFPFPQRRYEPKEKTTWKQAYAFFGVAFFLGVAFLVAGVLGVVLVTRPDLVLPKTAGLSTTAGA